MDDKIEECQEAKLKKSPPARIFAVRRQPVTALPGMSLPAQARASSGKVRGRKNRENRP